MSSVVERDIAHRNNLHLKKKETIPRSEEKGAAKKSMLWSETRYEVAKVEMMIGKKEMCSTGNCEVK